MMNSFEYANATTVEEALSQMGAGRAVKAGGVDLLDLMKEGLVSPKRVINIRNIPGLGEIDIQPQGARIGPLVTLAALGEHRGLRAGFRALADAALGAATPQIRNMASAGGNLLQRPRCWYFRQEEFHCLKKGGSECFAQDGENQYHAIFNNELCAIVHPSALATALVAFDATLEISAKKGKREVPIANFFIRPEQDVRRENVLGADELITGISVPSFPGLRSAYRKQKEKESFDWPIADVAVVLQMDKGVARSVAVVLGAAAPVPLRSAEAERELTGKRIDETIARRAAKAAMATASPLAKNGYKLPVFEAVIRKTIMEALS